MFYKMRRCGRCVELKEKTRGLWVTRERVHFVAKTRDSLGFLQHPRSRSSETLPISCSRSTPNHCFSEYEGAGGLRKATYLLARLERHKENNTSGFTNRLATSTLIKPGELTPSVNTELSTDDSSLLKLFLSFIYLTSPPRRSPAAKISNSTSVPF